jgi:hypothetical protein
MSGWMDSFNQAVGLTDDPADVQRAGVDAQASSTASQLAEYKRQYNQGRSDFAPYRDAGGRSLATLQSSIYGTPQQYLTPGYSQLTPDETQKLGDIIRQNQMWKNEGTAAYKDENGNIIMGQQAPEHLLNQTITPGKTYYRGPDGKLTDAAPMQTTNAQQFDLQNFKPENTEAYQWQKKRTLEDLGNQMNLLGRGRGSTVQANATARALGDLNANEYEKGYNRLFTQKQDYVNNLLNLGKTAQGAAGSTSSLGQSAAAGSAGAFMNQGNSLVNLGQQGYANRQQGMSNLYGGIGAAANIYATGRKGGWWGGADGGGDAGAGWDTTSGQYGDASYNGDGQLWD